MAASYVFYAFVGLQLFVYILTTTLTVYLGGLYLNKASRPTIIIWLVVLLNFGILASFKWWNTFAFYTNTLFAVYTSNSELLPFNSLLLPLGISFYTFQAVGYLLDVYRGIAKPERNIAKFALFLSFFPQLIQGPISRHRELSAQLYASRKFNHIDALHGFQLMLWGLIKKLVIADRIFLTVTTIFANSDEYKGLYVLIGITVHVIWLYMDFSGGVDIARGVGQMFGIILPQNFIRPFFSKTMPEYWRRWHCTLNDWWRDYLFYPLLRSKSMTKLGRFVRKNISDGFGKMIGIYICIVVVRVVNAMWHGADAYFIAEGLYFGIIIVLGIALAPVFKKIIKATRINTGKLSWKVFQIIRTFVLVCISRIFMATAGVVSGIAALSSVIRDFNPSILFHRSTYLIGLNRFDALVVIISLLVVFVVEVLQENGMAVRKTLVKQNIAFQWLVMLIGLWAVLIFGHYGIGYDPAAFVYMGF